MPWYNRNVAQQRFNIPTVNYVFSAKVVSVNKVPRPVVNIFVVTNFL